MLVEDSLRTEPNLREFKTYSTDSMLTLLCGQSVYESGDFWFLRRSVEALAQSLVESGDLEPVGGHFRVVGKAMATLSEYEIEERRHRDTLWVNRILVAVTILIAIGTIYKTFAK